MRDHLRHDGFRWFCCGEFLALGRGRGEFVALRRGRVVAHLNRCVRQHLGARGRRGGIGRILALALVILPGGAFCTIAAGTTTATTTAPAAALTTFRPRALLCDSRRCESRLLGARLLRLRIGLFRTALALVTARFTLCPVTLVGTLLATALVAL